MKFILKTLLLAPSSKKLFEYRNKFLPVFKERDPMFDELYAMISEFHKAYEEFPSAELVIQRLQTAALDKLVTYVNGILSDPGVPTYHSDSEFFAALEDYEKQSSVEDIFKMWTGTQTGLAKASSAVGTTQVASVLDDMLVEAHRIKTRLHRAEASTATLLYGAAAQGTGHSLREIYTNIKTRKDSAEAVYYDIGIKAFDKARLKDGDLVFFGAFTSHGKSVLLRHCAYRQVVYYGRNTAFFSNEMSHDAVRVLFAMLHANNKDIFSNTPYIIYEKWKDGDLSEEEEDFLFNIADYDLRNNPRYGTLYIDQPNQSKFRLSDLSAKLMQIESIMPLSTLVVDYLTLLYALESDRGTPDIGDVNNMIKAFKNLLLTHRNVRGESRPLLGITAAQISRPGLDKALKVEGIYDISAFERYSEIEKSADHLFTVLMTAEMKATRRMRIQHLKNRDGEVCLDPADIFVDLERGFTLSEVAERSSEEQTQLLQSLQI